MFAAFRSCITLRRRMKLFPQSRAKNNKFTEVEAGNRFASPSKQWGSSWLCDWLQKRIYLAYFSIAYLTQHPAALGALGVKDYIEIY